MSSINYNLLETKQYDIILNYILNDIGINYCDDNGPLLYHLCIHDLSINFIELVIHQGADVNQINSRGESVLECVILGGCSELYIRFLLSVGAVINQNVLTAMAQLGHDYTYNLIKRYDPNVNGDTVIDNRTLFQLVCMFGNYEVADAILNHHRPNVSFILGPDFRQYLDEDMTQVFIKHGLLADHNKRMKLH